MHARLSIFCCLLWSLSGAIAVAQDQRGEAKRSSEESMKKVDDGKPILTGNMMQHMMQAQMYRAQQNYAKAAEEDMKAQMLREQLRENQESRDKNEKRRDQAVYSSDAAQTQLKGTTPGGSLSMAGGNYTYAPVAATAAPSLSGLFAPVPVEAAKALEPPPSGLPTAAEEEISSEFIIFDESAGGPATKTASNDATATANSLSDSGAGAASEEPTDSAITADSIANFQQELSRAENQMVAANAADVASQLPVRVGKLRRDDKKEKEDDENFWKLPVKKAEKSPKDRRSGRRSLASEPTH